MSTEIGFKPVSGIDGVQPVNDENPLPVYTPPGVANVALGRLFYVQPFQVPGIAAADALDALDAMGTVFAIDVPTAGAIVKAVYHDLDDEGISKELWIFRSDPGSGVAASDAAFALSDAANALVVDVLTFSTFKDGVNNQISAATEVPCWYTAPTGRLWFQLKTTGADNIADGSMPRISFVIERYDLG